MDAPVALTYWFVKQSASRRVVSHVPLVGEKPLSQDVAPFMSQVAARGTTQSTQEFTAKTQSVEWSQGREKSAYASY